MLNVSCGSNVFSVEFGWGSVEDVSPNRNFGVRYLNKSTDHAYPESILVWYDPNGCRCAGVKTKQTIFKTPQEILPISCNSII